MGATSWDLVKPRQRGNEQTKEPTMNTPKHSTASWAMVAWALVLASPVWYPTIAEGVRRKLLTFARRVMSSKRYDYGRVNQYLEEA